MLACPLSPRAHPVMNFPWRVYQRATCRSYLGLVIVAAELWARLLPETKLAVRRHRGGVVYTDVAAEVTRASGLSYTWWLGDRPPSEGWMLPAAFVGYVDEIAAEES